jgi:hypothetical protein
MLTFGVVGVEYWERRHELMAYQKTLDDVCGALKVLTDRVVEVRERLPAPTVANPGGLFNYSPNPAFVPHSAQQSMDSLSMVGESMDRLRMALHKYSVDDGSFFEISVAFFNLRDCLRENGVI